MENRLTSNTVAHALFEDRFEQFVALGVPGRRSRRCAGDHRYVERHGRAAGSSEWSRLAQRHLAANQSYMASLAYGCAKFPCLANEAKRQALAHQVTAYLAAAPGFPVKFERRLIAMPFADGQ